MEQKIKPELNKLKQTVLTEDITKKAIKTREWGGADVVIRKELDEETKRWLGESAIVIGLQHSDPRRRAVITEYSKELSWLFYQLKDVFSHEIDYVSKYDFYGLLAQAAINYLDENEESKNKESLLLSVLNAAKEINE